MRRIVMVCLVGLLLAGCGGVVTAKAPSSESIIAAWRGAGLEAENAVPMTREMYGPAPLLCEGTRFFIPSLGPDNGGRLFICPNTVDRDKLATHYRELAKITALAFSYVYVRGNVIFQINGNLPEEQAKKYETALP